MQKKKNKLLLNSLISRQKFTLFSILPLELMIKRLKTYEEACFAHDYFLQWFSQNRLGPVDEITVVMAALAFPNHTSGRVPDFCHGEIAPFGRAHYYKEMMDRLKAISADLRRERGLSKRDIQLFCNSRFPEKPMAWAAGLGFIGRNTLLIHPEMGSSLVLGGMMIHLPIEQDSDLAPVMESLCGDCQLCVQACPQGALKKEGGLFVDRCLQHLSTSESLWPDSVKQKWGRRFYGCEICQQVCPFYQQVSGPIDHFPGHLGAKVNLETLLQMDDLALKAFLKPTVLGRSWIPQRALLRNAIVALQGQNYEALELRLKQLADSGDELFSDALRWLLSRPRA